MRFRQTGDLVSQTIHRALRVPDTYRRIGRAEFLFCSGDGNKSDSVADKHFDRFLDPLVNELRLAQHSCVSLAFPYSTLVGDECWSVTYSINRSAFIAGVLEDRLKRLGLKFKLRKNLYRRVLRKVKPKAVFCIGAPVELCEAGHELGIPIVEVLHGRGYPRVFEFWVNRKQEELPSHVISYDRLSTETFARFGSGMFEVLQMSDPWTGQLTTAIDERSEAGKSQVAERESTRRTVLFSLQWGYAGDHRGAVELIDVLPNGLMPQSVLDAVSKTSYSVDWLFRLHPIQLKGEEYGYIRTRLNDLLQDFPNAEWEDASSVSLPALLPQITHHMTMASMTAYQAAEFGVRSMLLCPNLAPGKAYEEYFQDLRQNGFATVGEFSADEIVEWVMETERTDPLATDSSESEDFPTVLDSILASSKQSAL